MAKKKRKQKAAVAAEMLTRGGKARPQKNTFVGRSGTAGAGKADSAQTMSAGGTTGWVSQIRTFLAEVKVEFDKVAWPTKKETIAMTTAVLAITFFFTAYLGLVDMTLSKLVAFLIY
ncbi:MAG TPA: preprotein translocase subunit SecE [Thermodesulfobacteriaceae bacterium]|nr:preprotein translocase subunit SecE [Thermodesulfobacteriaceae bacterium]